MNRWMRDGSHSPRIELKLWGCPMWSGYKARGRPEKRWPIDDQALVVSGLAKQRPALNTETEIVRMGFVSCVQVKKRGRDRERGVKAGRAGDWAGGGFEERLFRCLGTGKEFARSCVCEAAQRSALNRRCCL